MLGQEGSTSRCPEGPGVWVGGVFSHQEWFPRHWDLERKHPAPAGGAPMDGFGSHPACHPGWGTGIWTSRAISSPSADSSVGVRGTTAPGECLSPGTELFPGVCGGETCAVEPGPQWPLRSCSPHWLVSWTGVPIPERRSLGTPLVPLSPSLTQPVRCLSFHSVARVHRQEEATCRQCRGKQAACCVSQGGRGPQAACAVGWEG